MYEPSGETFYCSLFKVSVIYMQVNMQTTERDTSDRPRCTGRRPTGLGWSGTAGECSLQPAALHSKFWNFIHWLFIRRNMDSDHQGNTSRLWWVCLHNAALSSLSMIPASACCTVSTWQQTLPAWLNRFKKTSRTQVASFSTERSAELLHIWIRRKCL